MIKDDCLRSNNPIVYFLIFWFFSSVTYSQRRTIPFHLNEQKNIILEYSINGENVNLIFDTGTDFNFIDINFSDRVKFLNHKTNKNINSYSVGGTIKNMIIPDAFYKTDSVFNGDWYLTDMNITRKQLKVGDDVNGLVGINYSLTKDIIEINFKNSKVNIWDSIPKKYLMSSQILKAKIFGIKYGYGTGYLTDTGTRFSDYSTKYGYINSSFTVADSIQLNPLFLLDTGCGPFAVTNVSDSILYRSMVDFKVNTSKKYGKEYPTTRLQIPELGIDSLYVNMNVIPPNINSNNTVDFYSTNKIEGLLGMGFFLKYEVVLFDCKNKFVYFIK